MYNHAERTKRIIERCHLTEKIEKLTGDLLKIPGAVQIEYDLDGFLDAIPQVICLVKYDIPVTAENYFDLRSNLRREVISVAREHGLRKSEDTIEDYGEHFYFVFYHDESWRFNICKYN